MKSKHIFFSEIHIKWSPKTFSMPNSPFFMPFQIRLILLSAFPNIPFQRRFPMLFIFCLLFFKPRSLQGTSWSFSGCHDATNFVCGRFLGKKLLQKPNSRFIHSFIQLISYSTKYTSLTIFNFTHANSWWVLGIFQSNVESGLKFTTCRELYNVTIIG